MDEMIYTFIKFKNGESIITLIDKETEKEKLMKKLGSGAPKKKTRRRRQ